MANTPFFQRALRAASLVVGPQAWPQPTHQNRASDVSTRLYQLLMDYYQNTDLYNEIAAALYGQQRWTGQIQGLYNPAYRLAEFYVKFLHPGPLRSAYEFETGSQGVQDAVQQVWGWSNWASRKSLDDRWAAIFGDRFLKVHEENNQVRIQLIDPRLVTDFDYDERQYLTFIRLDETLRSADGLRIYVRTEVWDKSSQTMKIWERETWQIDITSMGPPLEQHGFEEFGINFIPFAWTPFKDIGEKRGVGAYTILKDKIDELNRMATRLHSILFRFGKPTMAVQANAMDATGRPMAPPRLGRRVATNTDTELGDTDVLYLPGQADVKFLVPNIDYQATLAIIQDQLQEIERDAPELSYSRLIENRQDLSSRAVRLMLDPAIKSVLEVRANLELGLIRADQMAITIGQAAGLFSKDLGTYESGAFDHSFVEHDVIPLSEEEQGKADQSTGQAATYWLQVGIKPAAIGQRLGFKPSEIGEPPVPAAPFGARGTPQNTPSPDPNPPPPGA